MWNNRSFAFRVSFIICLLSLLGILSVIFINHTLSRKALENEIRERTMPALVKSIDSEITERLGVSYKSVEYIARWPFLTLWIQHGENPAGYAPISSLCRTFVDVFNTGHINIAVDGTRHFYEAADRSLVAFKELDSQTDAWFDEFKASGKRIRTKLHAPDDPKYGGQAFANVRIEDEKGRFLGTVGVSFPLDSVEQLLATQKIGTLGRTFIVRPDGTILMHSDPGLKYKSVKELPGVKKIPPEALAEKHTVFRVVDDAGRGLLVGTLAMEEMEAIIFTVADEEELFQDIDRARNYSLAAALAVIALTMFAGLRISGVVTRSVQRIITFAGMVAANEAPTPLEPEGAKEMRELAAALNNMNQQLRRSTLSLKAVTKIFDGLDTSLMVVDPETDEILFSNAVLRKNYHLADDPRGRKCWQILHPDMDRHCENCPAAELMLHPDAAVRREVRNHCDNRLYMEINTLINWTDDRKAMLIQRMDINDAFEAREILKVRLLQQELALAISQSMFQTKPAATLIDEAVARTGEYMRVSRLRVTRFDENQEVLICEHEWRNQREKVPSMLGTAARFNESHPNYSRYMKEKQLSLAVADISSMPGLSLLPATGAKAFLAAPIYVDGKLWGILAADDCQAPRQWNEEDINLLRLIADLLSGMLFRRTAEAKLLRMTSLVEEATQYITYIDNNGGFQYFNGSTCKLLGYSPEELSAGGLPLIFSENTMAHVRASIIPGINREGRLSFELPVVRKDGVVRIFSFEAFAMKSESNTGIGAIGLDITEKKRLQDELVTAKDAAEQSSRAKSEFLSRMSHEMRTPLNVVLGMTGIALNADTEERKRDYLGKIDHAATHLLGMINEILDMSNLEEGRFELKPKEFVFEALVGKVMDSVRPETERKEQRLSVSLDADIPRSVFADDLRLGQIITNLLENAVKFTPEKGRIDVTARLVAETNEDCAVAIAVADTGVGIPEEKIATLFTPFEQVDGGFSRKIGGAGLGLVLSRRIAEIMGGNVTVAANNGGGSVFTATVRLAKEAGGEAEWEAEGKTRPLPVLPAGDAALPAPAPETEEKTASAPPPQDVPATASLSHETAVDAALPDLPVPKDFSAYRVLIAEDVELNREIVMALLEPTGIGIDCAEDGREAVAMFLRDPDRYQIILMDINMPEVDGYEATTAIRASGTEQAMDVPIVAMTANAFTEDIERCLTAGMNGHIAKPITSDKLMAALGEYLDRRDGEDPAR